MLSIPPWRRRRPTSNIRRTRADRTQPRRTPRPRLPSSSRHARPCPLGTDQNGAVRGTWKRPRSARGTDKVSQDHRGSFLPTLRCVRIKQWKKPVRLSATERRAGAAGTSIGAHRERMVASIVQRTGQAGHVRRLVRRPGTDQDGRPPCRGERCDP
jgi:hypothetical protein